MFATGETVCLAEWIIIDDTCLVYLFSRKTNIRSKIAGGAEQNYGQTANSGKKVKIAKVKEELLSRTKNFVVLDRSQIDRSKALFVQFLLIHEAAHKSQSVVIDPAGPSQ